MSDRTVIGDVDLSAVDEAIERYGTEPAAAIPILLDLQDAYGYMPLEALRYVTERTDITPDQIYGVVTFYTRFRMTPVGEHIILVCHGTSCHVRGAVNITQAICDTLDVEEGGTTKDNKYTLEKVACLGCCSLSPCMMIDDKVYGRLTRKKVQKVFKRLEREEAKQ